MKYQALARFGIILSLLLIPAASLAACTRAAVPLDFEGWLIPTAPSEGDSPGGVAEMVDPDPDDYAVVWISPGDTLPIRQAAGISARDVGALAYDQRAIHLTGSRTMLGSSPWVEIRTRSGLVGWVPAWNLTEAVPGDVFCTDPRLAQLGSDVTAALQAEGGEALRDLLSPKRPLIVRFDPWNPETRIDREALAGIFDNPQVFQWGDRYASGGAIEGSFPQVVLPNLLDVFGREYKLGCNQILTGSSPETVEWPAKYSNLNFLSFHRAPAAGGNVYNWRTWLVAVEYIEGEPHIALLLQVRPPF